jgi:hypothetical protein
MIAGFARLRPMNDCNANHRPILSSEGHFTQKTKKVIVKHKKIKIWSCAAKCCPTSRRIGRLTIGRKFNFKLNIS